MFSILSLQTDFFFFLSFYLISVHIQLLVSLILPCVAGDGQILKG